MDVRGGWAGTASEEYITENIIGKPCRYCGVTGILVGADRLDNAVGHTPDNIVPACAVCNITRSSTFTHSEMVEILGPAIALIRSRRASMGMEPPTHPAHGKKRVIYPT